MHTRAVLQRMRHHAHLEQIDLGQFAALRCVAIGPRTVAEAQAAHRAPAHRPRVPPSSNQDSSNDARFEFDGRFERAIRGARRARADGAKSRLSARRDAIAPPTRRRATRRFPRHRETAPRDRERPRATRIRTNSRTLLIPAIDRAFRGIAFATRSPTKRAIRRHVAHER